jgi:hypothetical protein
MCALKSRSSFRGRGFAFDPRLDDPMIGDVARAVQELLHVSNALTKRHAAN